MAQFCDQCGQGLPTPAPPRCPNPSCQADLAAPVSAPGVAPGSVPVPSGGPPTGPHTPGVPSAIVPGVGPSDGPAPRPEPPLHYTPPPGEPAGYEPPGWTPEGGVAARFRTGRPSTFRNAWTWIGGSFGRNWLGVATGLVCTWFNIPMVILLGTLGAILGGIVGMLSGSVLGEPAVARLNTGVTFFLPLPISLDELVPVASRQLGFLLGGVLGAVSGGWQLGWMTLVYPWEALYAGDPSWPVRIAVGNIIGGLALGAGYTLWAVTFERWRLKIRGARPPSRREREFLEPIIAECAEALGLKTRPKLLLDDSREVNASAGSRHIIICQGLLDDCQYDRAQLAGVISHELGHWMRGDAVAMAFSRGVAIILVVLYNLSVRLTEGTAAWRRPLQWLVRILFWGIKVTVTGLVIPAQARHWREAEYAADQAAVQAGHAEGLHTFLGRVRRSFEGGRSGWDAAICRTHPPTELRLERLERPGKTYTLPDTNAPAAPMPVVIRGGGSALELD